MGTKLTALIGRFSALSDDAQGLRSKAKAQPDDMIRLAKILSRQAQLEMQLEALGVTVTPAEIQPITTDESCPF